MIDDEIFDRYVHEGFMAIPQEFRDQIRNVVIRIESRPSPQVRRELGLSRGETLLGLYTGVPLSERGSHYGVGMTLPDTVTLYKDPILDEAGEDPERIKAVIAETIWHEFGHYFGMDEYQVRTNEVKRAEQQKERGSSQ